MIDQTTRQIPPDLLRDRYGIRPRRQPGPFAAVAAVVALALLIWTGWAVWRHADGITQGQVTSFDVTSPHQVRVTLDIGIPGGGTAACTVEALAGDHTLVGQATVRVTSHSGHAVRILVIRTERAATTADVVACR